MNLRKLNVFEMAIILVAIVLGCFFSVLAVYLFYFTDYALSKGVIGAAITGMMGFVIALGVRHRAYDEIE